MSGFLPLQAFPNGQNGARNFLNDFQMAAECVCYSGSWRTGEPFVVQKLWCSSLGVPDGPQGEGHQKNPLTQRRHHQDNTNHLQTKQQVCPCSACLPTGVNQLDSSQAPKKPLAAGAIRTNLFKVLTHSWGPNLAYAPPPQVLTVFPKSIRVSRVLKLSHCSMQPTEPVSLWCSWWMRW